VLLKKLQCFIFRAAHSVRLTGMVVRRGEHGFPVDFKIWHFPTKFSARKGCFLSFEWAKSNIATFASAGKILLLPLENPL